jgi:hypothetical protein
VRSRSFFDRRLRGLLEKPQHGISIKRVVVLLIPKIFQAIIAGGLTFLEARSQILDPIVQDFSWTRLRNVVPDRLD